LNISAPHNGWGSEKVFKNFVMHKSLSTNGSGGMISGMKDLNPVMHKCEENKKNFKNSVIHKSGLTNASGDMISGMKYLNSKMHKSEGNEKAFERESLLLKTL
jgi:hypothetical protein